MRIPFSKMHGLGNDFVVVPWASPSPFPSETTQRLCDRHFGVGGDGVLLLIPSAEHDLQMIVLNADGSRAEMCGNGLRCAAFHAALTRNASASSLPVRVLTDVGPLACLVHWDPPCATAEVTAEIGTYTHPNSLELRLGELPLALQMLSLGNPHAVLFSANAAATFHAHAPLVSSHPAFEHGVNVTFARVTAPNELTLLVWERGVGPTLACGTAACAASAAAVTQGLVDPTRPVTARLPGGVLTVHVDPTSRSIQMTGPATLVFEGSLRLD